MHRLLPFALVVQHWIQTLDSLQPKVVGQEPQALTPATSEAFE